MSAAASQAPNPTFPSKRDLWLSFVVWRGVPISPDDKTRFPSAPVLRCPERALVGDRLERRETR